MFDTLLILKTDTVMINIAIIDNENLLLEV